MTDQIFSAKNCAHTLEYLLKRRSCPIKWIKEPGPSDKEIDTMIKAASRVPDHGKMFPWYFVIIKDNNRIKIGNALKEIWRQEEPEAPDAKLDLEAARFLRAPCVIGVISKIRQGKHPMWEQILSAGAACQNLCLAANAMGYATNWLTEWYSYNNKFKRFLCIEENENIAGFIYIGTPSSLPEERPRPDQNKITTIWEPGVELNKGAEYGYADMGTPKKGFDLKE
jgi:nitroreductase